VKINQFKTKLHQTVKETGLNSSETLSYSQQLDKYILIYQKNSKQKEDQNRNEMQNAFLNMEDTMFNIGSFLFKSTIDFFGFYRNGEEK
jgi:hypothetical protein